MTHPRTDKGYYSGANHKSLQSLEGLKACCLQHPGLASSSLAGDDAKTHARLVDRRAGIDPLIGHARHGGQLGKSRMQHDDTTLAAGYGLGASTCANCFVTCLEKTSKRWGEKENGTAQSLGPWKGVQTFRFCEIQGIRISRQRLFITTRALPFFSAQTQHSCHRGQ